MNSKERADFVTIISLAIIFGAAVLILIGFTIYEYISPG